VSKNWACCIVDTEHVCMYDSMVSPIHEYREDVALLVGSWWWVAEMASG